MFCFMWLMLMSQLWQMSTQMVLLKVSQISLRRLGQVIQRGFVAREKMHNAATIDGMAVSSTFLGIIHSMAHKTGAAFRLPYGRCVAVLLKSETMAEGVEVLAKAKTSTHIRIEIQKIHFHNSLFMVHCYK
ncbi:hypothetical protein EIN_522050 [Entamoeba invadens IP1]|uniref:Fe-containing alcohol dehydrogenase-like C-terminal domain-containing protein n=1 Tax=Entamoeba invadens IP1 TaxID=370355 RepID=A0A0A1UFM5_ENTIV|nr:hypothetical protein EIN_522050 [Entamoeba invadens IP1]ELP91748.1 hypothetical protein EIN_522050 [Entamoeba invadens IP1]|eukprot:XP_004258519.1 hypothetical protein EIN_522050 [Entamoeba invadens IP1]